MAENKKTQKEYMKQYLIQIEIPKYEKLVEGFSKTNMERAMEELTGFDERQKEKRYFERRGREYERKLAAAKKALWDEYGEEYAQGIETQSFENDFEKEIGEKIYEKEIEEKIYEKEIGEKIYNIYRFSKLIKDEEAYGNKFYERQIEKNKKILLEKYEYDYEKEGRDNMEEKKDWVKTIRKLEKEIENIKSRGEDTTSQEEKVQHLKQEFAQKFGEEYGKRKSDRKDQSTRNGAKREKAKPKAESTRNGAKEEKAEPKAESTENGAKEEKAEPKAESTRNGAKEEKAEPKAESTENGAKEEKAEPKAESTENGAKEEKAEPKAESTENGAKEEKAEPKAESTENGAKEEKAESKAESSKRDQSTEEFLKRILESKEVKEIQDEIEKKEQELAVLYIDYWRVDESKEVIDKKAEIEELKNKLLEIIEEKQWRVQIQEAIAEKEQELHVLYYDYYLTNSSQEVKDKIEEINSLYAQLNRKKVSPENEPKTESQRDKEEEADLPSQEEGTDLPSQEEEADLPSQEEADLPSQEEGADLPSQEEGTDLSGHEKGGSNPPNPRKKEVRGNSLIKTENRLVKLCKGIWNSIRHPLRSIKEFWNKFRNWRKKIKEDDYEIEEQADLLSQEGNEEAVRTEKSGVRIDYMPDFLRNKGKTPEEEQEQEEPKEDLATEQASEWEAGKLEKKKRKEEKRATKKRNKETRKEGEKAERNSEKIMVYQGYKILGEKHKRIVQDAINKKLTVSQRILTSDGVRFVNLDGSITLEPKEEKNNPWRDDEAAAKVGTKEGVNKLLEEPYKDEKNFEQIRKDVKIVVDPERISENGEDLVV